MGRKYYVAFVLGALISAAWSTSSAQEHAPYNGSSQSSVLSTPSSGDPSTYLLNEYINCAYTAGCLGAQATPPPPLSPGMPAHGLSMGP